MSRNIRVSTFRYGQSGVAGTLSGEKESEKDIDSRRRLVYIPTYSKQISTITISYIGLML